MNDTTPRHAPVMAERVIALLAPAVEAEDAVLVDATVGLGGHSEAALREFERLTVIGIDRDREALDRAADRLAPFGDRFIGVHAAYDEIHDVARDYAGGQVSGVFFDLGVSSMQLDIAGRGFAYRETAPLDMRMNQEDDLTAADVLNTYPQRRLAHLLKNYGDEKFATRIAREVVARRETTPFATSDQLVELLYEVIPAPARRTGGHPAKRTFQALRMEVNSELAILQAAIPAALAAIAVGGRVVVEAYHSGEDRLVKRAFSEASRSKAPHDLPVVPESMQPAMRLITRGSEQASPEEISANPRAASVRLRAIERIRVEAS